MTGAYTHIYSTLDAGVITGAGATEAVPRVAALGDSLVANATQTFVGSSPALKIRTGFDVLGYSLGRLRSFNENTWNNASAPFNGAYGSNFGRGSQCIGPSPGFAGINSFIPDVVSRRPAVVIYAAGTNNILSKDDLQPGLSTDPAFLAANTAYLLTALDSGVAVLRAGGSAVIIATIPISGTYAKDSTSDLLRRAVNTGILAMHNPANRVFAWDRAAACENGDGTINTNCFQSDTVHFSAYGAWKASLTLDTAISAILPSTDIFATVRAGTSLLTMQPGMLGAGGALSTGAGVTISGVVCTNGSLAGAAATADRTVASKEVVSGSEEKQVFTITPNNVSGSITFESQILSPALAAGDWYQAFCEIEDDGLGRWTQIQLQGRVTEGTSTVRAASNAFQVYSPDFLRAQGPELGSPSSRFLLVGCPALVPSGFTIARLRANLVISWPATSGTFVVKLSRMGVFKIPDPRTAWQ
jgi:hypothetical protein